MDSLTDIKDLWDIGDETAVKQAEERYRKMEYMTLLLDKHPYTDIARYLTTGDHTAAELHTAFASVGGLAEAVRLLQERDILVLEDDRYRLLPAAREILEGPWGSIRIE